MAELKPFAVSVRIISATLRADDITTRLSTEPSVTNVVYQGELWSLQSQAEDVSLESAIAELLHRLPSDPAVWDELATECSMEVFCGFHVLRNTGLGLSSELLGELARRQPHARLRRVSHLQRDLG